MRSSADSKCERASSERLLYIKDLRKYMDVDGYGKCGENSCFPTGKNIYTSPFLKENYFFQIRWQTKLQE